METSILIQARLSSKRLPGKILYKLGHKSFNSITLINKRLEKLKEEMDLIVITSNNACDDAIEYVAKSCNLKCLKGSENDVLERYFKCANYLKTKTIIRITSDCPLIDPNEIKRVLDIHKMNKNDYTTNTFEGSSIVDGFDVEVFSFEALQRAYLEATLPSEREHVTFYFKKENKFKIEYTDPKLDFPYTRLTLDTPKDFEAISNLIDKIQDIETIKMKEIIKIFYNNKLNKINSSIYKNQGWEKSFKEDKIFRKDLENK